METVQNDKQTKARIRQTGIRSVVDLDIGQAPEELLTVLLHDLRSPLGAIGVLVELLTTNAETGSSPDPRQMAMLQEAVVKAQRIMDDAVEIQSVLRGSSSFTPCVIEMETVVQNSIEKAAHAPYFREVNVQYDTNGGSQLIKVDVEKAESALLCALEQSVAYVDRPLTLRIYHSHANGFANLHIANDRGKGTGEPVIADRRALSGMNGRLGTRRLGESRFNLLLASKVLQLMGGALDHRITAKGRFINLQFPLG